MKLPFLLLIPLLLNTLIIFAQTKEELQKQEAQLRNELIELTKKLKETQQNKKYSLSQVKLIKSKIYTRKILRNKINEQINNLNNQIILNTNKISDLNQKLFALKNEYIQLIIFNYKNRSLLSFWNFIFSSTNFNESFKHLYYLKKYQNYQLTLKKNIENNTEAIMIKMENLKDIKKRREEKITTSNKELELLNQDIDEQNKIIKNLAHQEKSFVKELKLKEAQRVKMQKLIKEIIRKEALEYSKRNTSDKVKNVETNTGLIKLKEKRPYSALENSFDDIERSVSFENNKGNLPWPVERGYIDVPFGISQIPNTKLTRKSDGLEISVPENSIVKNIADGVVIKVTEFGNSFVVMVLHGKYVSVYSQLSAVEVKAGQQLKARSIIGRTGVDLNGDGILLLMITDDSGKPLNPEIWLKRKE